MCLSSIYSTGTVHAIEDATRASKRSVDLNMAGVKDAENAVTQVGTNRYGTTDE